mmetsp:Transcript_137354/g.438304  ORF Transcript_137354/g.438304 Transcript_137354/m.438304 type:complete len:266 (-) Transcript_137354:297-1094(-)
MIDIQCPVDRVQHCSYGLSVCDACQLQFQRLHHLQWRSAARRRLDVPQDDAINIVEDVIAEGGACGGEHGLVCHEAPPACGDHEVAEHRLRPHRLHALQKAVRLARHLEAHGARARGTLPQHGAAAVAAAAADAAAAAAATRVGVIQQGAHRLRPLRGIQLQLQRLRRRRQQRARRPEPDEAASGEAFPKGRTSACEKHLMSKQGLSAHDERHVAEQPFLAQRPQLADEVGGPLSALDGLEGRVSRRAVSRRSRRARARPGGRQR